MGFVKGEGLVSGGTGPSRVYSLLDGFHLKAAKSPKTCTFHSLRI
jgi:hypothetical protein